MVKISEQKGRIFKGQFTYSDGTKHLFDIIYPDNVSFTWVSVDSKAIIRVVFIAKTTSASVMWSPTQIPVGCVGLTKKGQ